MPFNLPLLPSANGMYMDDSDTAGYNTYVDWEATSHMISDFLNSLPSAS